MVLVFSQISCQTYCQTFGFTYQIQNTQNTYKMISAELMEIARHLKRWFSFCMPKDEKKKRK